jgi:hypothetical protein
MLDAIDRHVWFIVFIMNYVYFLLSSLNSMP